jgi:hypothetical protein
VRVCVCEGESPRVPGLLYEEAPAAFQSAGAIFDALYPRDEFREACAAR